MNLTTEAVHGSMVDSALMDAGYFLLTSLLVVLWLFEVSREGCWEISISWSFVHRWKIPRLRVGLR